MSAPLISVVIPAYNAEAFIAATLETLAAQTFKDFETIVVDDGSTDGTKAAVERFLAERGLAGRCIRRPNGKIAKARNAGIEAARAEWISFLDHDDAFFPDKLGAVAAAIREHPEADLISHHIEITENGRLLWIKRSGPWIGDIYDSLLFEGNTLAPPCVTVRKSKLSEIGGFDEDPAVNTAEDYDAWMRLSRVCRFHLVDRALARYHSDPRGASRRVLYHHTNVENLLNKHFERLFKGTPGPKDRRRIRRRLADNHRAALGAFIAAGGPADLKREYALKMLRTWPWRPKNLARAAQWFLGF